MMTTEQNDTEDGNRSFRFTFIEEKINLIDHFIQGLQWELIKNLLCELYCDIIQALFGNANSWLCFTETKRFRSKFGRKI